jgi:mono/diheme cytochrome c family protein
MKKAIRSRVFLAAVVSLACAAAFAQSPGAATYKAKCLNCHGAAGLADTATGRSLKVKPITDPEVAKISAAVMFDNTKNGIHGKMIPYKDKLTDEQIKEVVAYFRTFLK